LRVELYSYTYKNDAKSTLEDKFRFSTDFISNFINLFEKENIKMSTETKKEKKGPFKIIFIIEILILIAGFITAFYFIFSGIFGDIPTDLDIMWRGLYILWGSIGYVPIVILPTLLIMIFKRKGKMMSSLQSFKLSKIGPYAPGYKPSGAKKPRFCEYCGYEVLDAERECPECGGPVKTINSSYI